ncbi:MAG: PAS domain S-box protein, partial [Phycisphaerae bacterium]
MNRHNSPPDASNPSVVSMRQEIARLRSENRRLRDHDPGRSNAESDEPPPPGQNPRNNRLSDPVPLEDPTHLLDLTHDAMLVQDGFGRLLYWNHGAESIYGWSRQEVLGRNVHELLKTDFPCSREEIELETLAKGMWEGELTHTARDGSRIVVASRWVHWHNGDGEHGNILEVNREITERKKAEEQLRNERTRLGSVLNMIPGFVAIKDADYRVRLANDGFLDAFGDPGDRPCYQVQFGRKEPCDHCVLHEVLEEGESAHWECTYPGGRHYQVWAYPFTDLDGTPTVLEIGVDITRQKQAQRMVARAGEIERRSIGRDLHDVMGQNLTGLGYLVEALTAKCSDGQPGTRKLADQMIELVNECVEQVRLIAHGLDPVGLEDEPLPDALAELGRGIEGATGVACHVHCNEELELDNGVSLNLYRIAQEAATNAVRHGKPSVINIELQQRDGDVILTVADDGKGLRKTRTDPDGDGMGIRIMHHRAVAIGATL